MKIKTATLYPLLIIIVIAAISSGVFWFYQTAYNPIVEPAIVINPTTPLATSTINQTLTSTPVISGLSLPILMYHYIENAPATTTMKHLYLAPDIFARQLKALKDNNFNLVFVSEMAKKIRGTGTLPPKAVALTFDDGYADFYDNVFPLLKEYQLKATLYVIINRLDQVNYLSSEQVKEMASSGLVEIGSHTFNHPDLRKSKAKAAQYEIEASRLALERISGQTVKTFCYPFGGYKPEFFALASSTGYEAAVSVMPGVQQSIDNIWLLKRLRPSGREGEVLVKWLETEWKMKK